MIIIVKKIKNKKILLKKMIKIINEKIFDTIFNYEQINN